MGQESAFHSFTTQPLEAEQQPPQQQPLPDFSVTSDEPADDGAPAAPTKPTFKRKLTRIIGIVPALALAIALSLIWHSSAPTSISPGITQQNFGGTSANTSSSTANPSTSSGDIQVYVVGAVRHPGVYPLPAGARVYQLLQAAGGPLPDANLVALNLAAPLNDGEEVYVVSNGEIPPAYQGVKPGPGVNSTATTGQLVNINTESPHEMRQALPLISTTSQIITNYPLRHQPYHSLVQLHQ